MEQRESLDIPESWTRCEATGIVDISMYLINLMGMLGCPEPDKEGAMTIPNQGTKTADLNDVISQLQDQNPEAEFLFY